MTSAWPKADAALIDEEAERSMQAIMDVIGSIRNMRAEVNADPHKRVSATLIAAKELMETLRENSGYIELLGLVESLTLLPEGSEKPSNAMAAVNTGVEVYLPLAGLIDVELETKRLNKELDVLAKELARSEGKLKNEGFLANAPKSIVEMQQAKAEECRTKIGAINERLAYLKTI